MTEWEADYLLKLLRELRLLHAVARECELRTEGLASRDG